MYITNSRFFRTAVRRMGVLVICLFTFHLGLSAQATADAMYNKGLGLQGTMTVAAQNEAIACFSKAKNLYDAAKDKKKCDKSTQVSRNIIKRLRSGGGGGSTKRGSKTTTTVSEKPSASLELSNSNFKLDNEGKVVSVSVAAQGGDWTALPVSASDGTSFLSVSKKDDNRFDISCPRNTSTISRTQTVEVRVGDIKKLVTIEQEGRPVTLMLGENLWECSWKGGDKTIDIYSNSEAVAADNSEQNWSVESKPSWATVTFTTKKKKGFLGRMADKAVGLVSSKAEVSDDPTIKATCFNVVVERLKEGTSEYNVGRRGEVVFVSGGQRATLVLVQKGK